MTAFEPEAIGNLVEGLEFHKFYFDNRKYQLYLIVPSALLLFNVHPFIDTSFHSAYLALDSCVDKCNDTSRILTIFAESREFVP